jgi:4-amino-4-deoxy-L-arabinose transferase-like glycosyltransferase
MRPLYSAQSIRWLMLALATILSLHMNMTAVSGTVIDEPIRGDASDYVAYALHLKIDGVFSRSKSLRPSDTPEPDSLRAPGYPVFIMPFVDASKKDFGILPVLYIQALLGALTTLISMLVFVRIMPFTASILCGVVVATSPHLVNASVYLLTESLFTFLLVSHVYALIVAKEKENLLLYGVSGIVLAASWLVRPTTLLLPLVYILMFGYAIFKKQMSVRALACLVLPFVVVLSGWSIRNEMATGRMSDPQLTASFIHHGAHINLMYKDRMETYGYPYRYDSMEINTVGDAMRLVRENFKSEPWRYIVWVIAGKPIQFLSWRLTEGAGDVFIFKPIESPYFNNQIFVNSDDIAETIHPLLMMLAVAGCLSFLAGGFKGNFALQISAVIVLYFVALHAIGAPFPRYSIPIRPFCYGLAFYMAIRLYPHLMEDGRTNAPV